MLSSQPLKITYLFRRYLDSFSGLPIIVWKGIFISLIESTLIGICYYLSLYFVEQLHLTVIQSSILISSYGIGTILGGFFGGKFSDRMSPAIVSSLSLLLQSCAFLILNHNHIFYFLIPNLFIMGIGSYGFITSNHVWVLSRSEKDEQQRLKAINILSVASNLGLGISSIIISLFTLNSFKYIFNFAALLFCCIGVYLIHLDKRNPVLSKFFENKVQTEEHRSNPYSKSLILYVLCCLFLVGVIISQYNSTYPLFLSKMFPQMGMNSFSILFIINTLMVVFFQTIIIEIFGHSNKILLIGLSTALLSAGMLLLSFSTFYIIAILSIILLTIGEILFFSLSQLIVYEHGSKEKKGHSLGLYRMVFASSRIAGPFIGGVIYQKLGGDILWYVCCLLGMICFIPSLYFKNRINISFPISRE